MTTVASKRRPAESPAPDQRKRRSARHTASAVAEPPHSVPQVAAREATRRVPSYLMESPHEGARLEAKTDADAAAQQLSRTGLRAGMRALDVGCGTGAVTRVMAELAAPGRVTGVDISRSRLTQARQLATEQGLAIDFMEGDALHLSLPSAAFDYTWTRFLFEYLSDPEQALAELIRVTRPGGIVAVADLDGQLDQHFPIDGALERTIQEGLRLLGETGFDPRVGRKLYHWCYQAGLRDIVVQALPYQVYAGALPEGARLNWREKLATSTQRLIERTGDRARWERFRDDYLALLERPDTFYYCTLILVHGTVPSRRDETRNKRNTQDRRGTRAEGGHMAVVAVDSEGESQDHSQDQEHLEKEHGDAFTAIWEHYLTSGFLYPAKLERLEPALDLIRSGWPLLLAAPPEVFQLHLARKNGKIASSVCAFRDTDNTYVVQHAVSSGQPLLMLACLRSCWATITADPEFEFARMFFRPQNRWPARLVRSIAAALPRHLSALTTQDYLVCRPQEVEATIPPAVGVEEVAETAGPEVVSLATAAVGALRTASLGIGKHPLSLPAVQTRYANAGLSRGCRVLGVVRDGALAGVACCYWTSVPMNFSFLCSRVELLVHPESPDRASVVRELARAAIHEAALRGDPLCTLVIDAADVPAAVAGGFEVSGKQYSSFFWGRENEHGSPSVFRALDNLYTAATDSGSGPRTLAGVSASSGEPSGISNGGQARAMTRATK